jgi:hypothetical protein
MFLVSRAFLIHDTGQLVCQSLLFKLIQISRIRNNRKGNNDLYSG